MKNILTIGILPFLLIACNSAEFEPTSQPQSAEHASSGRISLPLTATDDNGTEYRLQYVSIALSGTQDHSIESDGEESISISLLKGDYTLTLEDGWILEQRIAGAYTKIDAELQSENPQDFEIVGGESTRVALHFSTVDGDIEFEEGDLDIDLVVDSSDGESEEDVPEETTCTVEDTYSGNLTITTQEDMDAFTAQYQAITGNLTIEGEDIEEAALGCLESASWITLQDTSIQEVVLTNLEASPGLVLYSNPDLLSASVPRLEEGGFTVEDNASLETVELSQLQEAGSLSFQNNDSLTVISLPELQVTDGSLYVLNNPSLQALSFPQLVEVGTMIGLYSSNSALYIEENDQLTEISFPSLVHIGYRFRLSSNASLTSLDGFQSLMSVGDYMWIASNASLTDVMGLSNLEDLRQVYIRANPRVPEDMVEGLLYGEVGESNIAGSISHYGSLQGFDYFSDGQPTYAECSYICTEESQVSYNYVAGMTKPISMQGDTCEERVELSDGSIWELNE